MSKAVSFLVLAVLLNGCEPRHETMPTGFKLVCDVKGRFAAARTNDGQQLILPSDNRIWRWSKRSAILRAWDQYEFESRLERPQPSLKLEPFSASDYGFNKECPNHE